jgi:phospholipase/carboxylesterase
MHERTLEVAGLPTTVIGDIATAKIVVVLLHGFAMEPSDLSPFALSLGVPGLFLFPRAPLDALPEPDLPRGRAWWHIDPVARMRALAVGPRDFCGEHPAGLPDARATLGRFLDAALDLDPRTRALPWVLGGFSQGGMLACETFLRAPRPLAGLALLSSSRIAFDEWQPLIDRRADELRGLPVFVSHGRADRDLAFRAGEALRDCLAAGGADVTWVPFDEGHEVPLVVWRRLRKFLMSLAR